MLAAGQAQVVLGPCPDGGYYLVGLTEPQPPLFQGPAWSSSTVLTDTLRLARQLGLRVHLLPPWPDIDTYDNLRTFLHRARPAPQPGWRSREQARRLLGRLSDPRTLAGPLTPRVGRASIPRSCPLSSPSSCSGTHLVASSGSPELCAALGWLRPSCGRTGKLSDSVGADLCPPWLGGAHTQVRPYR